MKKETFEIVYPDLSPEITEDIVNEVKDIVDYGRVFIIEGVDGTGKTTLATTLHEAFTRRYPTLRVSYIKSICPLGTSYKQAHEMYSAILKAFQSEYIPGITIFDRLHLSAYVSSFAREGSGDMPDVTSEMFFNIESLLNKFVLSGPSNKLIHRILMERDPTDIPHDAEDDDGIPLKFAINLEGPSYDGNADNEWVRTSLDNGIVQAVKDIWEI